MFYKVLPVQHPPFLFLAILCTPDSVRIQLTPREECKSKLLKGYVSSVILNYFVEQ